MRTALRVVAHLVAEVPLGIVAGLQIAHGWLPTSDDAVIAWRTWSVFSGPVPLDGQFTQISAASGHAAFDLGPLQYYLLAVPERIDPLHGLLWGAALLAAVLVALAVEAAWSVAGPLGAAVVAAGAAVTTATLAESTVNLAWNPSLGVYALVATLATAVAAGSGRLGWLPVAVAAGSLAAQCHVAYAASSAAALAVGLALGLLQRERGLRRLRPVAVAVAAGVACWVAPVVQQLTGHPGNWSVLASSLGTHGRTMGADFGLRAIASATHFPPSWARRPPPIGTVALFHRFVGDVYGGSVAWGVAAIALCGGVAVAAGLRRHRLLAAMAGTGSLAGLGAAFTLGSVPESQLPYLLYYLYFVLWPVGMLMTVTLATAAVVAGAELARPLLRARGRRLSEAGARSLRTGRSGLGIATLALAAAGAALAAADMPFGSSGLFLLGWQPVGFVAQAAPRALALLRQHGVGRAGQPGTGARSRTLTVLTTGDYPFVTDAVSQGVAYILATEGVPVRLGGTAVRPLGSRYEAVPGAPAIVVHVSLPGGKPRATASWRG